MIKKRGRKKAAPGLRLPPKLTALYKSAHRERIHEMLDAGRPVKEVHEWILSQGFKISQPQVYQYNNIRKEAARQKISLEDIVSGEKVATAPTPERKLKSDIQVLDKLIETGYDHIELVYNEENPMPASVLLSVIKMKNDITGGSHGNLTGQGLSYMMELEKTKYEMLMQTVMSFIDESHQAAVVEKIHQQEENYYKGTEFYADYLKAKGLPEGEIERRLGLINEDIVRVAIR